MLSKEACGRGSDIHIDIMGLQMPKTKASFRMNIYLSMYI